MSLKQSHPDSPSLKAQKIKMEKVDARYAAQLARLRQYQALLGRQFSSGEQR